MADLSFEEGLKKLDEIVAGLEKGDLPLDESIKLFEEGKALAEQCGAQLKAAQEKVDRLMAKQGDT